MRKPSISGIKKKLHKMWADKVRERDSLQCQWCLARKGSATPSRTNHAHHIVSKGIGGNACRFEIENGMILDYYCHIFRLKNDPDQYILFRNEWLAARGLNYKEMLFKYRNNPQSMTKDFIKRKTEALN